MKAAPEQIQSIVARVERLEAEKSDTAEAIKEVYAEAKGEGYDTAILRKLVALRKKTPDEIAEADAILDMYKDALGMTS